ncbi:hypothetical protein [Pseudomonas aeruginosa]|uniref:hypothetical protein n=1 Tax=Pseudomonas aeruginosa TaxID=287 RepID=UPI002B26E5B3|nr:hypothetical protein [Pseudomonas aeruginosa]MEA8444401.1 hypothetical protein [Pseudomonas aeruginosa]
MNKANECTCPSGNGSLVHPCPTHPAVEQAGGDERAAFERAFTVQEGIYFDDKRGEYRSMNLRAIEATDAQDLNLRLQGWQARAALAQPSPAQAEKAEVVARVVHSNPVVLGQCGPLNANDELMTVAQHERIVGELRAVIAQLRQHKNDYMDSGQETYRALQNEIREREAEIARLDGLVSGRTAERDAALARVAELERQEPVALANRGLHAFWVKWTEAAAGLIERMLEYATRPAGDVPQAEQAEAERPEGPTEDELEAAGLGYPLHKEEAVKLWYSGFRSEVITVLEAWEAIGHDIGMNPDKGELLDSLRYMLEKCEAHDAALAEVAGLRSLLNSLLCYVERDIDRMRSDRDKSDNKEIYDRSISLAMERLKAAQNAVFTTEPGCDTAVELAAQTTQAQHCVPELLVRAEDFVSGKEVPQAWLDVQAERRRQITAEGWTPEHDDLYCAAELPRAAAAYILNGANDEAPAIWPFSAKWWKPRDARSNYVRAGALILAEIERLDRAAHGKEGV